MKSRARVFGAGLFVSLAFTPVLLLAQRRDGTPLTGAFSGGAALLVSEPKGDFKSNTGNGFGLGAHGLWSLDKQSIVNLRLELGFLSYATSHRRISLANSGNLVKLDLETTSSIFTMAGGPQLLGPEGAFRPYATALGGFSYFFTETSVEGSEDTNTPFASTKNASDFSWAYGGAVGAYMRVYNGSRPVRLDLGARYLRHDNARYLNDQRIEEAFENDRDPIPIRSRADFVTYFLGVNVILF